jgi:hypothetical protein
MAIVVQQILTQVAILKEILFAGALPIGLWFVAQPEGMLDPFGHEIDFEGHGVIILGYLHKPIVSVGPPSTVVRQVRIELGPIVDTTLPPRQLFRHGVINDVEFPLDLVDVLLVLLLVDVVGVDVGLLGDGKQPE